MKAMEVHYTSLIILMEWIPPNHHAFYLDCLSYIYIFTVLIYINVSFKILYFDEVFIKMQNISLNDIYTLFIFDNIIYTTIRLEFKYFEMNLLTFKISSAFNHLS